MRTRHADADADAVADSRKPGHLTVYERVVLAMLLLGAALYLACTIAWGVATMLSGPQPPFPSY